MTHKWLAGALTLLAAAPLAGAEHNSPNFLVSAPSAPLAQQVAEEAERHRKQQAVEWLGAELPPWPRPCEIKVIVTGDGDGGETEFKFDRGQVRSQKMRVQGRHDRILDSVLPHEVTHTIFAARFGRPVPRWADEGGAVLSEDYLEHRRHDLEVRQHLNAGRHSIPLRRLFVMTEYPAQMEVLYTEGFSVSRFLVARGGKRKFLQFVEGGLFGDWEGAAQRIYGFAPVGNRTAVEMLESAWLNWLRVGRDTGANPQDPYVLALVQGSPATRRAAGPDARLERVVRGQAPDDEAPVVAASSRTAPARPPAPAAEPAKADDSPALIPIAVGRARRGNFSKD